MPNLGQDVDSCNSNSVGSNLMFGSLGVLTELIPNFNRRYWLVGCRVPDRARREPNLIQDAPASALASKLASTIDR